MKKVIEQEIKETLIRIKDSKVKESMEYSLNSGGKRLRPMILLSLLKDFKVDYNLGLPFAISLEMIHTYSLVHDDLPAMDDDDYRRHRLTNHKVFGEDVAILTGDALLTYAFENTLQSTLSPEDILLCINILSKSAGIEGMIYGQELDITNKMENLNDLIVSYQYKTGKLFAAAFELAMVISDNKQHLSLARTLGHNLGVLFQVQDDLLEYTQSFEEIGKNTDSDVEKDKVTIVSLLGIDEAFKYKEQLVKEFYDDLSLLHLESSHLKEIIDSLVNRNY